MDNCNLLVEVEELRTTVKYEEELLKKEKKNFEEFRNDRRQEHNANNLKFVLEQNKMKNTVKFAEDSCRVKANRLKDKQDGLDILKKENQRTIDNLKQENKILNEERLEFFFVFLFLIFFFFFFYNVMH